MVKKLRNENSSSQIALSCIRPDSIQRISKAPTASEALSDVKDWCNGHRRVRSL
jgi:hypothetical protein